MEPLPIFPGLEVADPQIRSRQFVPPMAPQSQDLASTEVASYYVPPKDISEPYIPDHSPSAAIDVPVTEVKENGNRSWIFIAAIAAVLTAIIVGAAVGGGLGSALSSCQNNLRSSRNASGTVISECTSSSTTVSLATHTTQNTASSTTTCLASFQTTTSGQLLNYEAVPSKNVSTLGVDCDALQKNWQVTSQGEKYSALCNVGFEAGTNRTDGDGNSVTLAAITTLIAYSLSDCLEACSGYTYNSRQPGRNVDESCGSVVFRIDMADNYHANCLLLNSTVTHHAGGGVCDTCISATRMD
ncbi:hypothetical protein F5Y03DRAFT_352829 [Xylaria venustula]|nr:hypothetical protein F5Y03DRAFT_352829 [Xylaria venustula]